MSSELQQIASRTNGAKSLGPLTEEGKQASSQNRLDHGFNSKRVVLPGESQEEFDDLLASYLDEHQPETPTERTLIENMAVARWRQQRAWNLETAGLANEIRRPRYHEGEDPETQAFVAFRTLSGDSRTLDLLNRYEARFERQFRAALTAFLHLRTKRRAEERAHANAVAANETRHISHYWVDEEGNRTSLTEDRFDPEPPTRTAISLGFVPQPEKSGPKPSPETRPHTSPVPQSGPGTKPVCPVPGDILKPETSY